MANIKSAIKRVKTTEKKRIQNQKNKSDMKSMIKQVEKAVQENNSDIAATSFREASRKIDKAIQKGIIHQNKGKRQKKRLANKIANI
ncbi:30S ribosomal protein S20 [Cerasibacillus terrae]|uniref:Small ribosomal subunit protein bS20 n=1 Tax=Cerasibacillus terrae TaxID=2498845 RepID=A0A5C8P3C9_9BACI|nr:30S ribosomal protein S20 [Cerasibacillus terrae]TXL68029.1 30S ribosomal protein S20 [Cerasibacillus terrae]